MTYSDRFEVRYNTDENKRTHPFVVWDMVQNKLSPNYLFSDWAEASQVVNRLNAAQTLVERAERDAPTESEQEFIRLTADALRNALRASYGQFAPMRVQPSGRGSILIELSASTVESLTSLLEWNL